MKGIRYQAVQAHAKLSNAQLYAPCNADEKPLSDVWMLTVAAPVAAAPPKEVKSHKRKDPSGLKMITSYNLFCEHRRPEVRQAKVSSAVDSAFGALCSHD